MLHCPVTPGVNLVSGPLILHKYFNDMQSSIQSRTESGADPALKSTRSQGSHVLNFCLGKIKILAKIEIKMLRFRKKQVRKWSTRCCFVTFEISSSEINVTKSHYFITNYIFTGFLKNCENRKNIDVNQNTQDCHW